MRHEETDEPDFQALAACADNRLSAAERARAIEHLASCARCRTIVAELVRSRHTARPSVSRFSGALALAASLTVALAGGTIYWVMRDTGPGPATTVAQPAAPLPGAPAPAPAPTPSLPPRPAPATPSIPGLPPDRPRSGGPRVVGGKTFQLIAGEWVDRGYHLADGLRIIDIQTDDDVKSHPALAAFAELGPRFTVVIGGAVYRVTLPTAKP
jgi:anti-sigma factor RsiW